MKPDAPVSPAVRRPKMPLASSMTVNAILLAAFFLTPYLAGGSRGVLTTCITIAIFAVMAYGVDLILSYLGEMSLGHVIFWAAGGYVTGYLTTQYGVGPLATLAAVVLVSVAAALILGLITLRAREFVFALVTYAAAIVVHEIVFSTPALGASDGIVGIPMLQFSFLGLDYAANTSWRLWPVAFGLLAITVYFVARFRQSRLGRMAMMVHMNPALATSMGIDVRVVRVAVFVLSAPITALAGWLYAYQRAYVGPDMFEGYFLLMMLSAVILFGQRLLLGPLLGIAVIIIQQNYLSFGGDVNKIIMGAILVSVLIFLPKGLAGSIPALVRRLRG